MKVRELKKLIENVPDEAEVTVWADAADCCHQVESAFHLSSDDSHEIQSQLALIETAVKLQDIVKRGFRLGSTPNEDKNAIP